MDMKLVQNSFQKSLKSGNFFQVAASFREEKV